MITFAREGSMVHVEVNTGLPSDTPVYVFKSAFHDDVTAQIVMRYLEGALPANISSIRERAYNSGWQDAKAHKQNGRLTVFNGCMDTEGVGYVE